jgi:uncharacterized membrane protein
MTLAQDVNVGSTERLVSAVAGGALAVAGLRARSVPGALAALVGGALVYRGVSGHCSGYSALGINTARETPAAPQEYFENGIHVEESVTVNRTPWDLYQFWRDFQNLPRFMNYLESVERIDDRRSRWKAKAPAGTTVEWEAEIINDEPTALIAWRSLANANVDNAGSVRFVPAPGERGTEVKVVIDYIPPAGRFGAAVAKLFGRDPKSEIREDLRRFKQVMETGEVATTRA